MPRWFSRPRAVFTTWIIYWIALAIVGLGPAALAVWRATHGPSGRKSSVSAGFSNLVFNLTVVDAGTTTYAGSIHMLAAALWIAGPPLAIWLAWVVTSGRRARREQALHV